MGDAMKTTWGNTAAFFAMAVLLVLAVGCSKVTKENYDKLKVGQDYDEVVTILGKADECSGALGLENCRWGNDDKHIKVKFAAKKVVIFSAHGL
jgi:hypothetical protein